MLCGGTHCGERVRRWYVDLNSGGVGLTIGLLVGTICGFGLGQWWGYDEKNGTFNPLTFYSLMGAVQNSPYSWLPGTLWEEARDTRKGMLGTALSGFAGAGALFFGGTSAAKVAMLGTRLLWDRTGQSWRNWERDYERPRQAYEEWKGKNNPFLQSAMEWAEDDMEARGPQGYANMNFVPY